MYFMKPFLSQQWEMGLDFDTSLYYMVTNRHPHPGELFQSEHGARAVGSCSLPTPTKASSPLPGSRPRGLPPAPRLQDGGQGGEEPENILLEVLNHCRFLQAAVQRLEQKINSLQACRNVTVPEEGVCALPGGAGQLSMALANRLGPSPQSTPCWNALRGRSLLQQAPPLPDGKSLGSSRPPGGGRGKGRRRKRRGLGAKQGCLSEQVQLKQEGPRDEALAAMREPQTAPQAKHAPNRRGRKWKKWLTAGGVARAESKYFVPVTENSSIEENTQVMIGRGRGRVWIPSSVYTRACEEAEPQQALVTLLSALFPMSALSYNVVLGNRHRAAQQLNCNELEALREWLEEVYPQYDVSLKGLVWPQCLDIIRSFTDPHS